MRVFILGAGAAVHAKYPLGKNLLCEISKMVKGKNPTTDPDYLIKHDCLTELEKRGIDLAHGDCEEIVTDLEQRHGAANLVEALKACVSELFNEIQRKDKAKIYKKFAAQVAKQGDLIITFNYDTSLELELKKAGKWRIRDGYGFPPDNIEPRMDNPPSQVKVLKLHGSVNWLTPLRAVTGYVTPLIVGNSLTTLEHSEGIVPRFSHPVPWSLMIMPSRKKNFDVLSEHFWDDLWGQAQRGLQQASEVYLFGYSLPKADERARELILGYSNPEARTTVCCGESTERICGEFAQHVDITGPVRFEDWIEAHCHDSARCAPTPIRSPSLRHLA